MLTFLELTDWCWRVYALQYLFIFPGADYVLSGSLTLGGGYGWLSAKYGLVIDNLEQVGIPFYHDNVYQHQPYHSFDR